VAAFVLFHILEPRRALAELRRVLRPGGVLGTLTWDGPADCPAQDAWDEELNRHGAAAGFPTFAEESGLYSPAGLRELLGSEGFTGVRTWERPFDHAHAPEPFIALRTNLGSSRERFLSLADEGRQSLLSTVRRRFEAMPPEAFVDRKRALFTAARRAP
jgi:SAM-dependent methyltransferase